MVGFVLIFFQTKKNDGFGGLESVGPSAIDELYGGSVYRFTMKKNDLDAEIGRRRARNGFAEEFIVSIHRFCKIFGSQVLPFAKNSKA